MLALVARVSVGRILKINEMWFMFDNHTKYLRSSFKHTASKTNCLESLSENCLLMWKHFECHTINNSWGQNTPIKLRVELQKCLWWIYCIFVYLIGGGWGINSVHFYVFLPWSTRFSWKILLWYKNWKKMGKTKAINIKWSALINFML